MSFTNDNWFVIKDLNGFIERSRIITYNAYGEQQPGEDEPLLELANSDKKELDSILSFEESSAIIIPLLKKEKNKKTKKIRFIVSDAIYLEILENLGNRMTSNILHGLVQKGLVETGFDEEANDFIFWIKDEDKEKPETD